MHSDTKKMPLHTETRMKLVTGRLNFFFQFHSSQLLSNTILHVLLSISGIPYNRRGNASSCNSRRKQMRTARIIPLSGSRLLHRSMYSKKLILHLLKLQGLSNFRFPLQTQRFLHEVTADYVALTGLNMFSITRNFLLGVSSNSSSSK